MFSQAVTNELRFCKCLRLRFCILVSNDWLNKTASHDSHRSNSHPSGWWTKDSRGKEIFLNSSTSKPTRYLICETKRTLRQGKAVWAQVEIFHRFDKVIVPALPRVKLPKLHIQTPMLSQRTHIVTASMAVIW